MAYNITDSADIGSKGVPRLSNNSNNSVGSGLGTSGRTLPSSEIAKQGKQAPVLHGELLHFSFSFPLSSALYKVKVN